VVKTTKMSYYVYVLYSLSHKLYYIGHTDNLKRRLTEHYKGRNRYTKSRGPWQIVYKEKYSSRKDAMQREKYLKSGSGRESLKRTLLSNLER
jgi:putative endonuclease